MIWVMDIKWSTYSKLIFKTSHCGVYICCTIIGKTGAYFNRSLQEFLSPVRKLVQFVVRNPPRINGNRYNHNTDNVQNKPNFYLENEDINT